MNRNRQCSWKKGSPGFFIFSMILCLGSGIVPGQREKTKEGPDSWTVRLFYREENQWKTKKELAVTIESGNVILREGARAFWEIPAAGIRSLFYDRVPQKRLLSKLSAQGPLFDKLNDRSVTGAEIVQQAAAGWTLFGGQVVAAIIPIPGLQFAGLIAVASLEAIEHLKNEPTDFVHIIWQKEGGLHGAAIGLGKKQRDSLMSALEGISGQKCLNLPEERKRLEAEIKAQKSSRYEFPIHEKVAFGPLVLQKKDEAYKLVLLERKDGPSELYFFWPSVSMKSLRGVALVEVDQGESIDGDFQKNRDRRSIVSVKHGAGTEPRSIEEFQLGARRVRPVAFVDAGEPPSGTDP